MTSLREFHKATGQIRVGDVVLIHDDKLSGLNWKLARVEELIVGNDDLVRAANVQTSNPILIAKLHPREVSSYECYEYNYSLSALKYMRLPTNHIALPITTRSH